MTGANDGRQGNDADSRVERRRKGSGGRVLSGWCLSVTDEATGADDQIGIKRRLE